MTDESSPAGAGVSQGRRCEQRDLRLPVSKMFDAQIAQSLWDSLPQECRSDHFDKETMPESYLGAVKEVSAGGP